MYYRQLFDYNKKLVEEIFDRADPGSFSRVVEFGAGSGLFTIPLLERIHDLVEEYIIFDPFPGPYRMEKGILKRRLKEAGFSDRITIREKPIGEAHKEVDSVDLIIGHDVFCDLSMKQIKDTLRSCKGVLGEGGVLVHSGLSATATAKGERLLIKLDGCSYRSVIKGHWFSPGSEFLYAISREVGFSIVNVHEVKIPLKLQGKTAMSLIKEWNIREDALRKYEKEINETGIEFPKEQILVCRM
ncbi:MAG: class I SAM-dependent methyltransferase [Thermoplasmatota archaeon]